MDRSEVIHGGIAQMADQPANLRASLTTALAERDALRTLVEEINGRAQVGELPAYAAPLWDALRDIRALCEKELK